MKLKELNLYHFNWILCLIFCSISVRQNKSNDQDSQWSWCHPTALARGMFVAFESLMFTCKCASVLSIGNYLCNWLQAGTYFQFCSLCIVMQSISCPWMGCQFITGHIKKVLQSTSLTTVFDHQPRTCLMLSIDPRESFWVAVARKDAESFHIVTSFQKLGLHMT